VEEQVPLAAESPMPPTPPIEEQEPVAAESTMPATPSIEEQEPVAAESTMPATPRIEEREPVAVESTMPATPPTEEQEPVAVEPTMPATPRIEEQEPVAAESTAPTPPIEEQEPVAAVIAEPAPIEAPGVSTSASGPPATSDGEPSRGPQEPADETDAPTPKGREGGAEIFVLRPAAPLATGGLNVVPIRPGAGGASTFPPNPHAPASGGDAEIVELSSQERDAFREIARALGARTRTPRSDAGVSDANGPAAGPPPAGDAEDAANPAEGASAEDFLAAAREENGHRDAATLVDVLPIGALVLRDGEAIYLNQTLLDLVGFADVAEFRAADGLRRIFLGRDAATLATAGEGVETPMMTTSGELITVDTLARPISWSGEPATLVAVRRSREVEHRSRLRDLEGNAETATARARAFEAALDLTTDGVVRLDASGRILSMNAGAASLLHHPPKDGVGEKFVEMLAPASRSAAIARFEALSRDGPSAHETDGVEVFARASGEDSVPMRLAFGRLPAASEPEYCVVMTDLSEVKTAEAEGRSAREKAERASAAKTDYLAKVSHEIRTPLNAILGFAEIMMEEKFGPIGNDRYKDYIREIHASGQHVVSLANDLLDLAKIEAGRMEFAFSPVDANKVIRECVAQMQPQAARERIIMRLSLFDKLPNVMADERALRQIMLNLMSNAVKFNEPGGQVIVSTALDESGHPIIRVRDTGMGMDERELSVALEPFRQIPGRRDDGTGLGLPLTKALVEANHADFSIKSRKEHGTLVEVAFPSVRAAQ
jgi:signal transduction histidine kinase